MKPRILVYAAGMLITGSINTIATKYQDITVVGYDKAGHPVTFQHPAIQSAFMFLGEFLCLFPYLIISWRNQNVRGRQSAFQRQQGNQKLTALFSFSLPALCDAGATTMLNVGLFYTFASVFQMLRGTLVIFAGLLTIVLLKRRLHIHHWLGIVLISAGAAIVGASSLLKASKAQGSTVLLTAQQPKPSAVFSTEKQSGPLQQGKGPGGDGSSAKNPLIGDVFVIAAQLAAATQFIIEEKYLTAYRVPALLAVGLEGTWGLIISACALPACSFIRWPDGTPIDVLPAAIREIRASRQLQWSTAGSVLSIAFFNFFGISVTKSLSGAARATIDACRTLFIWMFSLGIGWERFHGLEVLGFIVLLSGTSIYNELIRTWLPESFSRASSLDTTQEPLLSGATTPPQPPPPRRPAAASAPMQAAAGAPHQAMPAQAQPQSIADSVYTMARSMRLGPRALSPHSLTSPAPLYAGLRYEESSNVGSDPMLPTSSPSPSHPSLINTSIDEEDGGQQALNQGS